MACRARKALPEFVEDREGPLWSNLIPYLGSMDCPACGVRKMNRQCIEHTYRNKGCHPISAWGSPQNHCILGLLSADILFCLLLFSAWSRDASSLVRGLFKNKYLNHNSFHWRCTKMEPLEHLSTWSRNTWKVGRYLWLPDQHFTTQVTFTSSKMKYSLPSYHPFPALIILLLEAFETHQIESVHRILEKYELSCFVSQGVWLPCFGVELKRIKSTGALLESGRGNRPKHNETTAYVHKQQMNSPTAHGQTAKADGQRPSLL